MRVLYVSFTLAIKYSPNWERHPTKMPVSLPEALHLGEPLADRVELTSHDFRWLSTGAFVASDAVVTHLVPVQQGCCVLDHPRHDLVFRNNLNSPPDLERVLQDTDRVLQCVDAIFHDAV